MNLEDQPKISVAIRKRPLNKKQIQKNQQDIVQVKNGETVIVSQYKQKVDLTKYIQQNAFNFDFAFDQNDNNQEIYSRAVRPLVQSAFLGAKVTCFAYGQTGSGKTYTMNGDLANGVAGLYYLGANDIFRFQSNKKFQHLKIQVSFFQIYCSRLFDLLNNRSQLKIREDSKGNVHIVGLQSKPLSSAKQFLTLIDYGSSFRVTSQNSTNADSSRSHAILQITLKQGKKAYGKLSFIDLAGCQRGADHMDQNKQTRIDGAQINKSLLSLKQCIRALDQGKGHTPFRGSKLTMVLKDSFVGFCRTIMIGNISPNINSCQNTLNTLRYADRVKQLKKPSNETLSKEDQLAKQLMLPRQNYNAVKIMLDKDDDAQDIMLKKQEAQKLLGIRNVNTHTTNNSNTFQQNLNQNYNQINNNNFNISNQCNDIQFPTTNNLDFIRNNQISLKKMGDLNNNLRKCSVQDKGPQRKFNQKSELKKSFVKQSSNKNNLLQDQKTVLLKNNSNAQQSNLLKSELQHTQQLANNRQKLNFNQANQMPKNYKIEPQVLQRNFSENNNVHYGLQKQQNQIQFNTYNKSSQEFRQFPQKEVQFSQFQNNNSYKNNRFMQNQVQGNERLNHQQTFQDINWNKKINSMSFSNGGFNKKNYNDIDIQKNITDQRFNKNTKKNEYKQIFNHQNNHNLNQLLQQFKNWNSQVGNDLDYYKEAHQYIINKLVQQEDQMTQLHSNLINKQIQIIKQQTKMISQLQQDKQLYQSFQYADFIQTSVQSKISFLNQLKKKVCVFKQHLISHAQCQSKIFNVKQNLMDDQQLLDDLAVEDDEYNDQDIDYNKNFVEYNQDKLY